MTQWQKIETAPIRPFDEDRWYAAHSERLLLWSGDRVQIGQYRFTARGKPKWESGRRVILPTHWMPLPDPPSGEA